MALAQHERPTLPAQYAELDERLATARQSLADRGIEPTAPAGEALLAMFTHNFLQAKELSSVTLDPDVAARFGDQEHAPH